jgi:hypothetical protein
MLNLHLVRSPLTGDQNRAILTEYNRLTSSRIPLDEFVRWVQHGPAGPAWHAILETDDGRVVGHTSLIPLHTGYKKQALVPAKSEYSFVHEEFRSAKIRGFENVSRPKFLILVDQLFRHCQAEGWGPYLVSTAEANHPLSRRVGCRPVEFSLWECLFILQPVRAARNTPNLSSWQRLGLLTVGATQQIPGTLLRAFRPSRVSIQTVPLGASAVESDGQRLSFFEDVDTLRWRYLEEQYIRLAAGSASGDFLIAKRGSEDRYMRVCQWNLGSPAAAGVFARALLDQARQDGALGVRWAVYEENGTASGTVAAMKKFGFVCARRDRTVMVHTKMPEFLSPELWKVNDSLFSFDP